MLALPDTCLVRHTAARTQRGRIGSELGFCGWVVSHESMMSYVVRVCCIVEGEDEVFKVEVEEGTNMVYQVHSKHLSLWKVSTMSMSASILQFISIRKCGNSCSFFTKYIVTYSLHCSSHSSVVRYCTP